MKTLSPIELMIDQATGYAEPVGSWRAEAARSALRQLAGSLYQAREFVQAAHAYHDVQYARGIRSARAFRMCVRNHLRSVQELARVEGREPPARLGLPFKGRWVFVPLLDEAAWVRLALEWM